jgi:hypothetical protein
METEMAFPWSQQIGTHMVGPGEAPPGAAVGSMICWRGDLQRVMDPNGGGALRWFLQVRTDIVGPREGPQVLKFQDCLQLRWLLNYRGLGVVGP